MRQSLSTWAMNGTGNYCLEIKADYLENLTFWFSNIGGSMKFPSFNGSLVISKRMQ